MIVIDLDKVSQGFDFSQPWSTGFTEWDDGDVYSMLSGTARVPQVCGTLAVVSGLDRIESPDFGHEDDLVRVGFEVDGQKRDNEDFPYAYRGWIRLHGKWCANEIHTVSLRRQLFSRFGGILETDAIANKMVLIIGVGSFGSDTVLLLVKSGVTDLTLMDDDRFDVSNNMRHWAGLSQVGRFKTKALKDLILDKNPFAKVHTIEQRVDNSTRGLLEKLVGQADVIVCLTDNRASRTIINRIAVEQRKVCFYAGAFRRAYGGQILRVHPYDSLCFQCFLKTLPDQARNQEVSSERQAQSLAYSDRPVPVEPGLANDIAPITQMLSKLVIQELIRGQETTLRSLDEDLSAPLYLWYNRRENHTEQQQWDPLEFNIGGFHIMRWYGVAIGRDPACPVCGDYLAELARQHGLEEHRTG